MAIQDNEPLRVGFVEQIAYVGQNGHSMFAEWNERGTSFFFFFYFCFLFLPLGKKT